VDFEAVLHFVVFNRQLQWQCWIQRWTVDVEVHWWKWQMSPAVQLHNDIIVYVRPYETRDRWTSVHASSFDPVFVLFWVADVSCLLAIPVWYSLLVVVSHGKVM